MPKDHIATYLDEVAEIAKKIDQGSIHKTVKILLDLRDKKGRLFILGRQQILAGSSPKEKRMGLGPLFSGGRLRDIICRRIRLNMGNLAEIINGVRGVGRRAADAKNKKSTFFIS